MSVTAVEARPTAVVPATTTWQEFPALWGDLLGEVWGCLRAAGIEGGCPNVLLYLDDVPHVEVGVELRRPCRLIPPVVSSTLPAGEVAGTVHRGPYAGLAAAHRAVRDRGRVIGRRFAGPRWEIYGPHRDDPEELAVEVYWLLS